MVKSDCVICCYSLRMINCFLSIYKHYVAANPSTYSIRSEITLSLSASLGMEKSSSYLLILTFKAPSSKCTTYNLI